MLIQAGRQRGFSLIELMVTIAVMVLLALLAVPSLSQYVENTKIHSTAELLYASVQQARTEAIRRNANVELVFTDQPPTAASVETTGLTTNGPNWLIRAVPPVPSGTHTFIEGKSGAEGGGRAGGGTSTVMAASASAVSFNPFGALATAGDLTVNLSNQGGTCAPAGATRCLRVVVSTGGQARLCDPAVTDASDTRKC